MKARVKTGFLVVFLLMTLSQCLDAERPDLQITEVSMSEDNIKAQGGVEDSEKALETALLLARSKQAGDHQVLLNSLSSTAFLTLLDSDEDYLESENMLGIERVLDVLMKNDAPSAHATIAALTQSPEFIDHPDRVDFLIEACVVVRPAPQEVIKFLDDHSQHNDGYTFNTIRVIIENGSGPALGLLEKKLADPTHPEEDKIYWIRNDILPNRNDLGLLQSCERLLSGGLPEQLRPSLVEVLFDYRPDEWFRTGYAVDAPPRSNASPAALRQLRKVGELALKTMLSIRHKKAIRDTLEEIDNIR